ncbi:hypothetical protein SLA2020_194990 [Shorea laevis]
MSHDTKLNLPGGTQEIVKQLQQLYGEDRILLRPKAWIGNGLCPWFETCFWKFCCYHGCRPLTPSKVLAELYQETVRDWH